jgi:putative transposase
MNAGNIKGDFSIILKSIKWNYTLNYKKAHNITTAFSLWQRGFWDHIIRNEQDLKNHIDYIHWNPIKHGYSNSPQTWKYSTYSFWYEHGYYPSEIGVMEAPSNILMMDFE